MVELWGQPRRAAHLDLDALTSVLVPDLGQAPVFTPRKGFRQGDPLSVLGWLLFINPLVKWLSDGLPAAAPKISFTPTNPVQLAQNGPHERHDNPPVPDLYRLAHQGPTIPALFFMDDAAYIARSRHGLVVCLVERSSRYLNFNDVHMHPVKTTFTTPQPKKTNKHHRPRLLPHPQS